MVRASGLASVVSHVLKPWVSRSPVTAGRSPELRGGIGEGQPSVSPRHSDPAARAHL